MLTCRIICVFLAVFVMASCGPNGGSRRNPTPTSEPINRPSEPTIIFPVSFEGTKKLERDSSGTVSVLQGKNLSLALEGNPDYQQLVERQSFGEMAVEFIQFFKTPFQLQDPKSELSVARFQEDDLGFHQVRLAQNYKAVSVMYSELIVHFDPDGHVYLVQGQYIKTPLNLNLIPKLTLEAVVEGIQGYSDVLPDSTYPGPLILPLTDSSPKLVYQLRSRVSVTDQSILLVDANNGQILRKVPTIYRGT